MTPGLKFSFAARAANSKAASSPSGHRISCKAASGEIGVALEADNSPAHETRSSAFVGILLTFDSVSLLLHRIIHQARATAGRAR